MRAPATSNTVRISLVIPTYNAGPLLDDVLAGLDQLDGVRFDELLAIDSGSGDGTVARLERSGFRVAPIDKREFDHGATRDRGIAMTTGEIIVSVLFLRRYSVLKRRDAYYIPSPEHVHELLERYAKRWPPIPPEELHASIFQRLANGAVSYIPAV